MKLDDIKRVAVLGAGLMGHGIAQSFLMGGYRVNLYDIEDTILEAAKVRIRGSLEIFSRADLIRPETIDASLRNLTTTTNLEQAVRECDFLLEAVAEDLGLKQTLFEQVESLCAGPAILATNTSSLPLSEIGTRIKDKGRFIAAHWFNPPQIVPAVEVVPTEWTAPETMETTCALLTRIRKEPVRINREMPGFIVNRIQIAMAREVLDLYEKGVASAEDIDRAIRGSIGFRLASIGPLRTMDLGGVRLWLSVCENLLPLIQSSADRPEALKRLVSQGHDGVKSGRGFFDYSSDYSKGELEKAIRKRDQEFLDRLKHLYWKDETDQPE